MFGHNFRANSTIEVSLESYLHGDYNRGVGVVNRWIGWSGEELVRFASNQGLCRKTGFSKDFFSSKKKYGKWQCTKLKKNLQKKKVEVNVFLDRRLSQGTSCIENPGEAG